MDRTVNNVTVEHNNYIGAPGNYALRHALIADAHHPFFFQVRPGIEYNPMQLANVVGVRTGAGWQLDLRTQAFAQPGPVTGPH